MIERGSLVRLVSNDRSIVYFLGGDPEGIEDVRGAYGMVVKPAVVQSLGTLVWHVVSFPDFGKHARVRSDACEEY